MLNWSTGYIITHGCLWKTKNKSKRVESDIREWL